MARTLTLVRHAKSDWDVPVGDRERPLSRRGTKQAPATGLWIAGHLPPVDLALVSPAERTTATWRIVARSVTARRTKVVEEAYTSDSADLVHLLRSVEEAVGHALLVSHNPALEELVAALTGEAVRLPTSALAVVELGDWSRAGKKRGTLRACGRPATEHVHLS